MAKKISGGLLAFISLLFVLHISTTNAAAAGETYTWKDYRTVTVSGGGLQGSSDLVMQQNPNLSGSQTAVFNGNVLVKRSGQPACSVFVTLYLFRENGDTGGRLWNPPPWDGPVIGPSGSAPRCGDAENSAYHNQWVNIGGTRPASPDAPERDQEKLVRVTLLSSEPLSRSPNNVTITIKKGGAIVASQTVPKQDDSGAADFPPDQTPVFYGADFKLEPGSYQVCATYVITQCQNFTKEKYEFLLLRYGTSFETPAERKITVNVVVPYERPCGSTFTASPLTVTATGPGGASFTKDTPPGQVTPAPNEQNAICTVNGTLTLRAEFTEGTVPGNWRLCVLTANKCVDAVKIAGEPLEVTIRTIPELTAPQEDPVCSTGTGFAGMTAWALCPLSALIIRTTEFVERNFIIPYLTVSPLQTGNNPVYTLWESMRNIANVAFIIAFMIIIFSQATSVGISNYGIKRLLPRLAVVAIATNISFFIVAFAIDAFNVFGAGISDLVMGAIAAGSSGGGGFTPSAGNIFAITVVAGTGLSIAVALEIAGPILGWLFGLLAIAFLIILIAVVVLILRQMIIILLVIVSPLAFVAWLLPNTEKYFNKWRQLLAQLLLMYPMIVLLFASGKIVQALINAGNYDFVASFAITSLVLAPLGFIGQADDGFAEGSAEVVKVFLGFFAAAAPLILIPFTFMAAGGVIARMYNTMQSRGREWGAKGYEKGSAGLKPRIDEWRQQLRQTEGTGLSARVRRGLGGSRAVLREARRANRLQEYERAKQKWLLKQGVENEGYLKRSAGIGGEEGRRQIMAHGVGLEEKALQEDLRNATAIFNRRLKETNKDRKTFLTQYLRDYLKDGTDEVTDDTGNVVFRFSDNQPIMQAMVNAAAADGAIPVVEEARLSPRVDQRMVDAVIQNNDGPLKSNGGYHLATNLELSTDKMRDRSGNRITDPAAQRFEMETQRLTAMSNAGATTIAGMDWGLLNEAGNSLADPIKGPALVRELDRRGARQQLKVRLDELLSNPDTVAKTDSLEDIQKIYSQL